MRRRLVVLAVSIATLIPLAGPEAVASRAAQESDAAAIRARRAASNAAIENRDLAGIAATLTDDVVVVASSGTVFRGTEMETEGFAAAFEDPEFITYVRTPTSVQVAEDHRFAAERGEWVGSWRRADGRMELRGTYQAQWQKREGQWLIRAELFVALACSGSAACAERH